MSNRATQRAPGNQAVWVVLAAALLASAGPSWAAGDDRGPGVPTSLSGIYLLPGELVVGPSFEYFDDDDTEYDPVEFGFPSPQGEFKGRSKGRQLGLLVAYGWREDFALELEGATARATLEKAPEDLTGMPVERTESGLGDVRARLTWRVREEAGRRPELFTFGEVFFPHDETDVLVGTADWLFNVGGGAVRGFRWGTLTLRVGFKYEMESASAIDHGEISLEYLKRLSPELVVTGGLTLLEGDEGSALVGLLWHPNRHLTVRLNNGVALTSHAVGWAPEVGVFFRFAGR